MERNERMFTRFLRSWVFFDVSSHEQIDQNAS